MATDIGARRMGEILRRLSANFQPNPIYIIYRSSRRER
jgi:hypothetical protein